MDHVSPPCFTVAKTTALDRATPQRGIHNARVDAGPELARRLKATREALDLSAAELCRRVDIKQSAYSQYEKHGKRLELDQAFKLVRAFDITLDWIYLGKIGAVPRDLASRIEERYNQTAPPPQSTTNARIRIAPRGGR